MTVMESEERHTRAQGFDGGYRHLLAHEAGELTFENLTPELAYLIAPYMYINEFRGEREMALERVRRDHALREHQRNWDDRTHVGDDYRQDCSRRGWSYRHMKAVAYDWHEDCRWWENREPPTNRMLPDYASER